MPNLTIRNFTNKTLDLVSAERFDAERIRTVGFFSRSGSAVTNFFNATESYSSELRAKPDARGTDRQEVSLRVEPFGSPPLETDIAVPPPPSEHGKSRRHIVLRLTLKGVGVGVGYETDVPTPSSRCTAIKRLDDGNGDDSGNDLTAVYVPGAALLAIYTQAALDAWMREIPDAWPLPSLSIPGTHNSPTSHKALPSVRCQAVSVPEQLGNGVRFLDVRVSAPLPPKKKSNKDGAGTSTSSSTSSNDNDRGGRRLALVHGVFPVSLTGTKYLSGLLDQVYAFLDQQPSETVIISLKREGTGKGSDGDLGRYLKAAFVDKRPERWYTEPRVPTLGDCRGRIVLMRRFGIDVDNDGDGDGEWQGLGWGLDASRWPDNCDDGDAGTCAIRVQDFYAVGTRSIIAKKVDFSHGHLERAGAARHIFPGDGDDNQLQNGQRDGQEIAVVAAETETTTPPPPFFVNFLSASNFFRATCWPERVAARVNPLIVEYLCTRHGVEGKGPNGLDVGHGGVGIVVTDWVGANDNWDLIRCIVGMNARLLR